VPSPEHEWIAIAMYHVDEESLARGVAIGLLHDNLLTVEVGCLRCEASFPASKPCVENYDGVTKAYLREHGKRHAKFTTRPL